VLTNSAGYYTFIGVQPGSTTITPSKSGYRFMPLSKTISAGTSDISGVNFIGATGYNIVGRIADGSGVGQHNISVVRSGSTVTALTNTAGYYTFYDVPDGTVTVTPGGAGLSFSPVSRTVTMNSADIAGQNFTSAPGYTVIGRIATGDGAALTGVTVTRSGSNVAVFTNTAGYFVFSGVPAGTYVVTPTLSGYGFVPVTRTVVVTNADVSSQNFIGSTGYTVTGRVYDSDGAAIVGADVSVDGGTPVQTNVAGYYTLYNVPNGERTITPSKAGYSFTPATRTVTIDNADLHNQHFIGAGP